MKYRKLPVVINAFVFSEDASKRDVFRFAVGETLYQYPIYHDTKERYILIETLEGTHKANVGDYIIVGIKGEVYPCKPDIFRATYEEVEPDAFELGAEVRRLKL